MNARPFVGTVWVTVTVWPAGMATSDVPTIQPSRASAFTVHTAAAREDFCTRNCTVIELSVTFVRESTVGEYTEVPYCS